MTPEPDDPVQRLLLVVHAAHPAAEIPDRLHLQKEMYFLTRLSEDLSRDCAYQEDKGGPWSETVEAAEANLELNGLVHRVGGQAYRLTAEGKQLATRIRNAPGGAVKKRLARAVAELVPFCHSLNEEELLLVTYVDYPDSAKNSIEVNRVMSKRKALAKDLLRRKLVSTSRAAELAGVPVREVMAW